MTNIVLYILSTILGGAIGYALAVAVELYCTRKSNKELEQRRIITLLKQ